MKVLFVSPHYPDEMQDFVRGLAEVGAQVYAVGDVPEGQLPSRVRRFLSGYLQVSALFDPDGFVREVAPAAERVGIDRVEALWEPVVIGAARLRERLGLPGMTEDVATGFRDKTVMKDRLRAAGLRVPHFARVGSADELREAAERIGYPLIVKPIDGAGTRDTYKLEGLADLEAALPRLGHLPVVNVEEFVEGDEHTYDAVSIDGVPAFDSVAQYHPKPLESRTLEWISPMQIVFRDPHARPDLADGIALGKAVLKALGMGTGFTHMEWYRTASGEVVFGEIAARAPGGRLVEQMNYANDFDVFREWARAVCWGVFEAQAHRRYHVATIFKRAQGQGRIKGYVGLDAVRAWLGDALVNEDLLPIGAPRRDWHDTLLSDGYLTLRHPDYATCRTLADAVVRELKVYAG